jgi:hypothetical protein
MNEAISAAIARKELPPMEPGAMCYMMSREGYGGDSSPHWPSHLMFFYTDADLASWGANLPGSPVVGMNDPVEHLTQFVVVVQRWSDGTEYLPATRLCRKYCVAASCTSMKCLRNPAVAWNR